MTTQKSLNSEHCEKVIDGWLALASERVWQEGLVWYGLAHDVASGLAEDYKVSLEKVCAVVAVLSPGCVWEQNLDDAETVIRAWSSGLSPEDVSVNTYNPQKQKAFVILDADDGSEQNILRIIGTECARKTKAFYHNLVNPSGQEVTIDRWIARAVLLTQNATHPTERVYALISLAFQNVARRLRLHPAQVQAIVWLVIRDRGLDHAAQQYLF